MGMVKTALLVNQWLNLHSIGGVCVCEKPLRKHICNTQYAARPLGRSHDPKLAVQLSQD